MGERRGPDKEQLIDALVLAFAHSEIANLVGTDALRSVLGVEYHEMMQDGVFDMQLLWELLSDQPAFEPATAAPPLCLIKTWQEKLGLEIKLPEELAGLEDRDRAIEANKCKVPVAEIKLLFRMTSAPRTAAARQRRDSMGAADRKRQRRNSAPPRSQRKKHPAWHGWLAGMVAAGTLAFTGITLYGHCQGVGGHWDQSQVTLDDLPTRSVTRMGSQVRAEVDPGSWRKLNADAKRRKLRDALLGVQDRGVKVIALRQGKSVVATAQTSRGGSVYVWLNGD